MGWANRITFFRIFLAPVFAGLFAWHLATGSPALLISLWVIFILSEFSDVLDGWVARALQQTSDLGKVLDPFSDVLSRLTVFLCLLLAGIAPLWFFLTVFYRETAMTFLRLLMAQRGVTLGASTGGKVKAWLYFIASTVALTAYSAPAWFAPWPWLVPGLFLVAALQSLISFGQYFRHFRRVSALEEKS